MFYISANKEHFHDPQKDEDVERTKEEGKVLLTRETLQEGKSLTSYRKVSPKVTSLELVPFSFRDLQAMGGTVPQSQPSRLGSLADIAQLAEYKCVFKMLTHFRNAV